ncbi:hypothetical protein V7111_07195 [Neobacillus niacini]|uniref:hypothetical protein n=1 Tax=Neobacillus niacini TaxID=86668 RepID=UPI0030000379
MAIVVQATFTGVNSTNVLGVADTGQTWEAVRGTFGIDSNQSYESGNTYDAIAVVESRVSNGKVSLNVFRSGGEPALYFRFANYQNNFHVFTDGGGVYLNRKLSGGTTRLANAFLTLNQGDKIEAIFNDNSIIINVNNIEVINTTDENMLTNTKHGFGNVGNNTLNRYDNFVIEDFNTGGTPTTQDGATSLTGTGTLQASGIKVKNGASDLKGAGTLASTGTIIKNAQATLMGNGLLTADGSIVGGVVIVDGSVSLIGQGSLTASGTRLQNALANLLGTGILTANADVFHIPVTIDGEWIALGTGILMGDGQIVVPKRPPVITVITLTSGSQSDIRLKGSKPATIHLISNNPSTIHLKGGIQ